jgi:multidrug efflux pump subunit AcrA (membrane-fusion protein)
MLIRISLIIAIIAGLAVSGLNFLKVKEKITTIQQQREDEKSAKVAAQTELASTKKDLEKTTADLKTTKTTLEATTAERDSAVASLATQTKRAERLTEERDKVTKERNDAQADLAAYVGTSLKPEQILALNKQYKDLQAALDASQDEKKLLGQKIIRIQTELDRYVSPEKPVFLPASLLGKVLVTDPKWNFVVLNIGLDQGVKEYGELLVNRNGKLVAKVIIRSAQKDRCIANVVPGWQLGEVMEGDQVTPAHPES